MRPTMDTLLAPNGIASGLPLERVMQGLRAMFVGPDNAGRPALVSGALRVTPILQPPRARCAFCGSRFLGQPVLSNGQLCSSCPNCSAPLSVEEPS